jgi:hypothetical protein
MYRDAGHSVRAAQHGGRPLVQQRARAHPQLHHEPQGPAGPGAAPATGRMDMHVYMGYCEWSIMHECDDKCSSLCCLKKKKMQQPLL